MPVLCTSVRQRRVQRGTETAFPAGQAVQAGLAYLADGTRDGAP
jgi:hypothetical protein